MPLIDVTFDIDANGILQVSARERNSGVEQRVNVTGASRLSPEEIARMVADAEQHAAEDADRRERIEARNLADGLVYQAERFLVQAGDGLPAELRAELEGRIAAVRQVIDGADVSQVRQAAMDLRTTLLELNPGGPAPDASSPEGGTGSAAGSAEESAVGS